MWRKIGQAATLVGLGILAGAVIIGRFYARARGGGVLSRIGIGGSNGGESVSRGVDGAREHLSGLRDSGATIDRGVASVDRGADSIDAGVDSVALGHGKLVSTNRRLRLFIDAHRGRSENGTTPDTPVDIDTDGSNSG